MNAAQTDYVRHLEEINAQLLVAAHAALKFLRSCLTESSPTVIQLRDAIAMAES